ncbi:MAG: hypothetical protein PVI59_16925 [Anaerolineae bacterium]|jgi:hypothetical protein
MRNPTSCRAKSIPLLVGSFTFAFLLGEATHELGHYLAHRACGTAGVQIHLDPFGGSQIVGVPSLPLDVMGVTSAAGPLFNLTLATACFLLLWRRCNPTLLPLLLWGPVAMAQEGVTFSLGLLTPDGDAQWIVEWGLPLIAVLTVGLALLLASVATMSQLLPVAALGKRESLGARVWIVMTGVSSLMLVRAGHSLLVKPASIVENADPLAFSLLLSILVAMLHRPLAALLSKRIGVADCSVTQVAATLAMMLATGMFLFQLVM